MYHKDRIDGFCCELIQAVNVKQAKTYQPKLLHNIFSVNNVLDAGGFERMGKVMFGLVWFDPQRGGKH